MFVNIYFDINRCGYFFWNAWKYIGFLHSQVLCQWQDIKVVKWHTVSISAKYEQTIENNDSCMPISRHRILLHMLQLWKAVHFVLWVCCFYRISGQHARCIWLPSLFRSGYCSITVFDSFKSCETCLICHEAFQLIASTHLCKVIVKARILVSEDRCALKFDLGWRVILFLVWEDAKQVERFEFGEVGRDCTTLCTRSLKHAG